MKELCANLFACLQGNDGLFYNHCISRLDLTHSGENLDQPLLSQKGICGRQELDRSSTKSLGHEDDAAKILFDFSCYIIAAPYIYMILHNVEELFNYHAGGTYPSLIHECPVGQNHLLLKHYTITNPVSYFRVSGSVCYVHVSKTNRTKLDPRARRCIFVGYDTHRKGWECMDPETKKVDVSCDVVFDEVSSLQIDTDRGTIDLSPFPDGAPSERGSNITPIEENIQQEETTGTVLRRTSRQRRQPDYLADYGCSVVSCFFYRRVM
ncbi:hypothetical protein MRB53_013389 [Persea americana]|uniref:Uncharacterized protein n=1 Tax=Persea americana TaxID=3435 RepID=A0ACC2K8G0_PERAE|nr:hypothetical protein MRB53_013389 [Persea americana]